LFLNSFKVVRLLLRCYAGVRLLSPAFSRMHATRGLPPLLGLYAVRFSRPILDILQDAAEISRFPLMELACSGL
jgi:hypothetical protein